jgi:tRNA (adenine37-N6)-methyltransferase
MPDRGEIRVDPIGWVIGPRAQPEDDGWGGVESIIRIDERFPVEALQGLEDFSHIEVVFAFHLADPERAVTGARHPRGLTSLPKVGIFSQRNKDRPNRIGLSRCEVLAVEGRDIRVKGLDAIDGTPVLDIKPFFSAFFPQIGAVRQPAWVDEITRDYY